ncbi:MAG: hypothetical protein ABI234_15970 [Ktedonobacteraceae bacterium]
MQGQGFSLDAIRKMVEEKVYEAVEGVANRIPNGQHYHDQFRQAISDAMDTLQQQAQSQMSNRSGMLGNLGNMTGKRPNQPGNPPIH